MDNVRIIFFDIDGTLIDMERKVISENTLNALSALKKKGIKICIATGHSPMQVPVFPGIEFDAFLTYNGSLCYDNNGVIFLTTDEFTTEESFANFDFTTTWILEETHYPIFR